MTLRAKHGPPGANAAFSLVEDFVLEAAKCGNMADLRSLIDNACRELKFDYFAIVHHIRFGRPTVRNVRLSNYPVEWIATLRQRDGAVDPVLRAAERASSGFRWSKLETLVRLSDRDRGILKQAARHGVSDGFTIPNHVPGEAFGSCHFAVHAGKRLPEENIYSAQLIGDFAFEAARRLIGENAEPSENYVVPAPLTERQRECLVFAARGKSDSVIAQLLNIKAGTVNEHIESAKRRYSVATRNQLVVRALFRSEILFCEVLD